MKDTRKLEILKDTSAKGYLSLSEPGKGGAVIADMNIRNIEALREVRRRYNVHHELLEACETALWDITQTVNYDERDPQTLATVAKLEAAIAKAKGQ